MSKLVILRGVSGSGKSTYAESVPGATVVSRDRLRVAFFGDDGPDYYKAPKHVLKAREETVTAAEHAAIRHGLREGGTVISDNTNTHMRFVNPIATIGFAEGAEVELKVIDVPLKEAIRRNAQRALYGGRDVPEDVIRKQHDALQSSKTATVVKPEQPRQYTGTPGKPKAFLCDIDGTLADMKDHREPYDLNVGVDEPRFKVIEAVNGLANSQEFDPKTGTMEKRYRVILMSGRKEDCRQETFDWLVSWDIYFDELHMRASDDNRKDSLIKADLFWDNVADEYDVQFVLDDRNQVVDMWRAMGLDCFQVQPGDF